MVVFKIFLFILRTEAWKKDKTIFYMKWREITSTQISLIKMPPITLA